MAMKPYPSNLIIFNVDERVLDEGMKLALKRSWTHIGEILVRSHAGDDDTPPCNFLHVMVKYGTRRYLRCDGGEADENWSERMEQHLLSTMRKISGNTVAFNRRQRKTGDPELALDFIEFELEAGALTFEFRLDSNGCVPVSCARIATEVREALSAGALGEPVRVRIPSARSYSEQARAHAEAKAAEAAREAAAEEERLAAEAAAREAAEIEAEELFMESPVLVAEAQREEAAKAEAEASAHADSPLEVAPLTEEEWEAEYGVPDVEFEIDRTLWEAVYADGTTREFDSAARQFVA